MRRVAQQEGQVAPQVGAEAHVHERANLEERGHARQVVVVLDNEAQVAGALSPEVVLHGPHVDAGRRVPTRRRRDSTATAARFLLVYQEGHAHDLKLLHDALRRLVTPDQDDH